MLPPLHGRAQIRYLPWCVQCTIPALSARMVSTRGRGGASQSEAGGQPTSTQGGTEGAGIEEERRVEQGSEESEEDNDHDKDNDDSESPHLESRRPMNHQSNLSKPKPQLNQAKKRLMRGRKGWQTMMTPPRVIWKHIVKYVRKGYIPIRGPPMNVAWNIQPARWLEPEGILGPPEIASARPYLLRHIGPQSPGCSFPWTWPMTLLMPSWRNRVIIPLMP